jgi:hypothetical protein
MERDYYNYCVWGVHKQTEQLWLLWRCYDEDEADLLSDMENSRFTTDELRIEVHEADYNEYEMNDTLAFRDRREWDLILSNPSIASNFSF